MADVLKSAGYPQAATLDDASLEQIAPRSRETAGPAGGLLIAVGSSLILWAVLVEAVRFASWLLF